MPEYDAAVVGSGPNGLSAAVALAQTGRKVVVLEAMASPGGGVRTEELTLPGFRHDRCSAIHPMAAGSPFFRSLPLEEHGLEWVHPEAPLAHPLDEEPTVFLERSLDATCGALDDDGPRWARLFRPLVEGWEGLSQDGMAPLGVPRSPLLLARFGWRALFSTSSLARRFRGPRARALLGGLAGHSVLPLDESPSAAIGLMLGAAGHAVGWPFPRGGAGALTHALLGLLEELGGEVVTDHLVRALDDVPTEGPVLFDTSPRTLVEVCGDAVSSSYASGVARLRYAPGACKLDWALAGPIPWKDPAVARAGTVHLGGTLEELVAAERAPWRGEHHDRPYVLVAQQSLFDDTRAPAGQHTGWAYCHVPNGSDEDRTAIIEAQMERYAPGFCDLILARHLTRACDLEVYNPNYVGGDVNGGAPTWGQLFTRPVARVNPYRTSNPRVFLCSASTPPGGGVHGMCGYYAAKAAAPEVSLPRPRPPARGDGAAPP